MLVEGWYVFLRFLEINIVLQYLGKLILIWRRNGLKCVTAAFLPSPLFSFMLPIVLSSLQLTADRS